MRRPCEKINAVLAEVKVGMTKIRTLIPPNARPGKSLIQVINPRTGKAVRVKVPKEAIPGQAIELEVPDESQAIASDAVSSSGNSEDALRLPSPEPLRLITPKDASDNSHEISMYFSSV